MTTQYVWYASYGSNLNRERFLCYIQGGKPEGSDKEEIGCQDPSLPLKEATHLLEYPLYFAMNSKRWQNQGVAFIGIHQDNRYKTYSRKYLITVGQFMDVVKQENNGIELDINLKEIETKGYKTVRNSWYGTIMYLGSEDGHPIFTFTSSWDLNVDFIKPSLEYLRMIIGGLRTYIELGEAEIIDYLKNKPGIIHNYTYKELQMIVRNM
ncbi:hypothetical protein N0O92_13390 [Alkalihalobacillus sp. MEB130]|uniref:hypothetical protein n=1 Tax=Alkalihalobacillus sp. MEB130 TaxID=2976704 RepID=UPI0028DE4873|nr:hypothetical protein [Alkalihalobacillus sp. MEB130]MDT8861230.1 hypothetical protein [Alkalihalobacillus sp. MEB130]